MESPESRFKRNAAGSHILILRSGKTAADRCKEERERHPGRDGSGKERVGTVFFVATMVAPRGGVTAAKTARVCAARRRRLLLGDDCEVRRVGALGFGRYIDQGTKGSAPVARGLSRMGLQIL